MGLVAIVVAALIGTPVIRAYRSKPGMWRSDLRYFLDQMAGRY